MTREELQAIKKRCELNKIIKEDQIYVKDVSALLAEIERLWSIIDSIGE
jgi:hypothetical protein